MRKLFLLTTPFLAIILALTSCKKSADNTNISYKIKSTNRSATVGRIAGGSIDWTSGTGYAHDIEFEAKKAENPPVLSDIPLNNGGKRGITLLTRKKY